MFSAGPLEMAAISGVAKQARFIRLRGRRTGRRISRFTHLGSTAGFSVLFAVAVATLTTGRARVLQKLGALAVSIQRKGLHNQAVALLAILADHRLLR